MYIIDRVLYGIKKHVLNDNAASPSSNGEIARNGSDVEVYSGGAVRNLTKMSIGMSFVPEVLKPDSYGNLSGIGGRWTASGSGTNEYYYSMDIPEPLRLLIDGSEAATGTLGSLADHAWNWGDNDSLGYNTIYVRDDSGDPDNLDKTTWMADWWNMAGGTPHYDAELETIYLDSANDQGFVLRLKRLTGLEDTVKLNIWARPGDNSSTGDITLAGTNRALGANGYGKPTALTFQNSSNVISISADGQWHEIAISVSDLEAGTDELPELMLNRDISEDSIGTSLAVVTDVEAVYE